MLGGSWIRSDGIFAQVLGKVPMNFSLFYETPKHHEIDVLNTDRRIGMFRFVSSSFCKGGILNDRGRCMAENSHLATSRVVPCHALHGGTPQWSKRLGGGLHSVGATTPSRGTAPTTNTPTHHRGRSDSKMMRLDEMKIGHEM